MFSRQKQAYRKLEREIRRQLRRIGCNPHDNIDIGPYARELAQRGALSIEFVRNDLLDTLVCLNKLYGEQADEKDMSCIQKFLEKLRTVCPHPPM